MTAAMDLPSLLPPVPESPDGRDAWWEGILHRAIALAQHQLEGQGSPAILLGGTAARLCYGLSRPSQDINLDLLHQDGDVASAISTGFTQAQKELAASVHWPKRRQGRGFEVRLSHPRFGGRTCSVDTRVLRGDAAETAEHQLSILAAGLRVYRPDELVRQKMALAIDPKERRRGRDRYDLAWWLTNRMECAAPSDRIALSHALSESSILQEAWDRSHRKDAILSRVPPQAVQAALDAALASNPIVLLSRHPQGSVTIDASMQEGCRLLWRDEPHATKRLLRQFPSAQRCIRHLQAIGWCDEEDANSLLRQSLGQAGTPLVAPSPS